MDDDEDDETEYDKYLHFIFSLLIYTVMKKGNLKPLSDVDSDGYSSLEDSILNVISPQNSEV